MFRALRHFASRPAILTPLAVGAGGAFGLVFGASIVVLSPATAGALGVAITSITCSSTSACVAGTNSSTGPGVAGTSAKGAGLSGVSTSSFGVAGKSTSGVGVSAASTSSSAITATDDASGHPTLGVTQSGSYYAIQATSKAGDTISGVSATGGGVSGNGGTFGVKGVAFYNPGVLGESTTGAGVFGSSTDGYGVQASSSKTYAIEADGVTGGLIDSSAGDGLDVHESATGSIGRAAIYGDDEGAAGGYGVDGESKKGNAGRFINDSGNTDDALIVYGGTKAYSGSQILSAASSDLGAYMSFNDSGDLTVTGQVTALGLCASGCAAKRVASYAPHESEPTIEDVGKARLVAGTALVPLDPAFRNVMDQQADYSVLVTPEGDSNGVFVARRTALAFVVQENRGGRSSITFSYRIVAKPFASNRPRLPMVSIPSNAHHPDDARFASSLSDGRFQQAPSR
jgi:hypothetical protein